MGKQTNAWCSKITNECLPFCTQPLVLEHPLPMTMHGFQILEYLSWHHIQRILGSIVSQCVVLLSINFISNQFQFLRFREKIQKKVVSHMVQKILLCHLKYPLMVKDQFVFNRKNDSSETNKTTIGNSLLAKKRTKRIKFYENWDTENCKKFAKKLVLFQWNYHLIEKDHFYLCYCIVIHQRFTCGEQMKLFCEPARQNLKQLIQICDNIL